MQKCVVTKISDDMEENLSWPAVLCIFEKHFWTKDADLRSRLMSSFDYKRGICQFHPKRVKLMFGRFQLLLCQNPAASERNGFCWFNALLQWVFDFLMFLWEVVLTTVWSRSLCLDASAGIQFDMKVKLWLHLSTLWLEKSQKRIFFASPFVVCLYVRPCVVKRFLWLTLWVEWKGMSSVSAEGKVVSVRISNCIQPVSLGSIRRTG